VNTIDKSDLVVRGDLMMEGIVNSIVTREMGSLFSSVFDPNPIWFRGADETGVIPVRNACRKAQGVPHQLKKALNRNAFLCGCLDYTEQESIEHLVVGFGQKHGSTTKVKAIAHAAGDSNNVGFPDTLRQAMEASLIGDFRAEVLLFHNHPRNPLHSLFDNVPLASSRDRQTMLDHLYNPLQIARSLMKGGRVRFYLGENGFVREFRTPDLLALIKTLGQR
jgi:hypothetical protein